MNQKRIVIYCRSAHRDQKTKESKAISWQVMALKKYAAKQGMKVVGVYIDDGVSGLTTSRPGLDKLRAAIKKGGIDVVLAAHPDRLSRNVVISAQLIQELEQQGVELLFTDVPIDSPAHKLMISMMKGFGELHRQQVTEKVKRELEWKKSLRCPHCQERIFKK